MGTESGLREMPISDPIRQLLDSLDDVTTVRDAMSQLGVLVAAELRATQVAGRRARLGPANASLPLSNVS
ncbi:hypothetical protein [Kineosporia sp. NBRC 101731]|uniref:hypothetical protein n=1 Tax=Kineosporia sp. NBRC 101731 TaxID=3032199 RepID=UPI002555A9F5|nr:hypothetical protein [Kineosporia sp. NBRC 101731]